MKKAAMFGLDARIALAIFGALSVISGAALYSAIKQARAISYLTEMQEFAKAWEAFYLDTGVEFIPAVAGPTNANYYVMTGANLETKPSGVNNWNGPYASYLNSHGQNRHILKLSPSVTWPDSGATDGWQDGICTTGRDCALWTRVWAGAAGVDESLAQAIDEYVDEGDGKSAGDFRWDDGYSYKFASVKNPND